MLSVNGKSHMIRHVLVLRIFGALNKLRFWQNHEEVLNWLNSASELSYTKATCRGHKVRSRAGVTGWGHMQGLHTGGMQVAPSDLHLEIGRVITVQALWVKRRCQLVVRLKANKCYQKLLNSLSFYINFLNFLNLKAFVVGSCPLAGSRPLVSNPDLRSQTFGYTYTCSCVWSIVFW